MGNILKSLSMATAGTACIILGSISTASAVVIDFDTDAAGNIINAPGLFLQTTALTDLYAPLGVTFSGPSLLSGGAILNTVGNFGVQPLSGSNFLAFNRSANLLDGGSPIDPETITFSNLASQFSIFASGGSSASSFQLQAFDINNSLLGSSTISTAAGQWDKLSFTSASGGIKQVILTGTGSVFVYDNLTVDSVPEPLSILGSLTAGAFGLALRRKYKRQEQA
jgi:hypothetical protein